MTILIDADGCPVVDLTLQIAKQFGVPVIILCDTSHQIEREGAQTMVFDKGIAVSYTHLRAHETDSYLVCRLLLEKKKRAKT